MKKAPEPIWQYLNRMGGRTTKDVIMDGKYSGYVEMMDGNKQRKRVYLPEEVIHRGVDNGLITFKA